MPGDIESGIGNADTTLAVVGVGSAVVGTVLTKVLPKNLVEKIKPRV